MSVDELDPIEELGVGEPAAVVEDGSVWARLRAEHKRAVDDNDPLYLACPVHPGIVYRYKYVPLENTKAATERLVKIRDRTDQAVASALDTLILALDEVMVLARDGQIPIGRDDQKLFQYPIKPLADPGDAPIKFDERLAVGLGLSDKAANNVKRLIRELFVRDQIIIQHALDVSEWIGEVGTSVRTALEGNLSGGS